MNDSKQNIGIDIAKKVFQLHWVDRQTGEIHNIQLKRDKFLEFFVNKPSCCVAMEACGGSQHWARELVKLGHTVKLLPAAQVSPFVVRNKSDAQDARAIWRAMQQPDIKSVPIKTEEQQGVLALHRMRSQLVKFRTMQVNGLRGLLTEYGQVMPVGTAGIRRGIEKALATVQEILPATIVEALQEQWQRIVQLDAQIKQIEQRLLAWIKQSKEAQAIQSIPGVGVLTASAVVASMGQAGNFKSGREFAAWLGLVPRQTGSGGKTRLQGISKRGDVYLRTLLVHGARGVLYRSKTSPYHAELLKRRPYNVAAVAVANKTARTIWALLMYGRSYEPNYVSQPPAIATR